MFVGRTVRYLESHPVTTVAFEGFELKFCSSDQNECCCDERTCALCSGSETCVIVRLSSAPRKVTVAGVNRVNHSVQVFSHIDWNDVVKITGFSHIFDPFSSPHQLKVKCSVIEEGPKETRIVRGISTTPSSGPLEENQKLKEIIKSISEVNHSILTNVEESRNQLAKSEEIKTKLADNNEELKTIYAMLEVIKGCIESVKTQMEHAQTIGTLMGSIGILLQVSKFIMEVGQTAR